MRRSVALLWRRRASERGTVTYGVASASHRAGARERSCNVPTAGRSADWEQYTAMVTTPRTKEQIYGELGDRIFDEIPYFYNEDEVPDISPKQPGVILDEPGVLGDASYA